MSKKPFVRLKVPQQAPLRRDPRPDDFATPAHSSPASSMILAPSFGAVGPTAWGDRIGAAWSLWFLD